MIPFHIVPSKDVVVLPDVNKFITPRNARGRVLSPVGYMIVETILAFFSSMLKGLIHSGLLYMTSMLATNASIL